MKKTFLLLTVLGLLLSCEIYSQTDLNNFSFNMYYESTGETGSILTEITGNRNTSIIDTIYKRMCNVDLSNVTDIAQIHVNVGTSIDSLSIFNYTFQVNDSLNLSSNMTYSSEGSQIYLGLFNVHKTDMFYYKVWIESATGELSEPKYFY